MLTIRQAFETREPIDDSPTPIWHLAKACGVDVTKMIHHMGKWNIEVFRPEGDATPCISKVDARRLMRFSSERPL